MASVLDRWPWFRTMVRRAEYAMARRRFRQVEATGGMSYTDDDLIYAAYKRCPCGAGMAYPRGCGGSHHWDCSAILTGRAVPSGESGALQHTDRLPFVFWDFKSESQPSVRGATTRPEKTPQS